MYDAYNSANHSGQIQLIMGPMFSGKTTELLRRIRRYTIAKRECVVIKYVGDTRYSDDCAATHDQFTHKAISTNKLFDVLSSVENADVVGIDEGQFYPDLVEFSERMANEGKIVVVAALDGTFQRKAFGQVLSLIPLCERLNKLSAVCMICQRSAAFTSRLGTETAIQLIGGTDQYISTCRKCFSLHSSRQSSPVKPTATASTKRVRGSNGVNESVGEGLFSSPEFKKKMKGLEEERERENENVQQETVSAQA